MPNNNVNQGSSSKGNFGNMDKDEHRDISKKGGEASQGGRSGLSNTDTSR